MNVVRIEEADLDNRDDHTTWIQVPGTDIVIEIDPYVIFGNMVENCFQDRDCADEDIETSDLQAVADLINPLT